MPAERAGYTVTMFLIDISPSMGTMRSVDLPPGPDGQQQTIEMTHLEWALQFVKLKIQEMIFNGRKTDQCSVILFGSEGTKNVVNKQNGGYDHVTEYISIGQPNAGTLSKIDALEPSDVCGDPIDALVVGIETQANYLSSKKTWTRKVVMVTDGESPIEVEDWETIAQKMDNLNVSLTLIGIDFDDEEFGFIEPNKTSMKKANEKFYHTFTSALKNGVLGTCEEALQEIAKPDIKQTKSALLGTVLRLGDVNSKMDEAIELTVKTSKCTALTRPPGWKKFALRDPIDKKADEDPDESMDVEGDGLNANKAIYAHLKMRSEYHVDLNEEVDEGDAKMQEDDDNDFMDEDQPKNKTKDRHLEKVENEQLVKGFKYGTTYAPCPEGQFPRLSTKKGIDLCGFFPAKNFRRELSMGEVQYIWADPGSAHQQVALSSVIQAMYEKNVMAIARWVTRDDMDPRMGVLAPVMFDEVDCLLWVQMPFADDVRKYTFASLDHLTSKKGEIITEHPYIPTEDQKDAMDEFVDAMDLMTAGEKDDEGNLQPWFDTLQSYNPAVHRIKQAMFHCAVVSDINTNPLPPPHPELTKYLEPPKRVLKHAQNATDKCKAAFKVRQVPKKVAKAHKGNHEHAEDDDDNLLLLDRKHPSSHAERSQMTATQATPTKQSPSRSKTNLKVSMSDSETEDEDEEMLLDKKPTTPPSAGRDYQLLPTPARSASPEVDPGRAPGRIIGSTYPLADFKRNISQGDVVTKAVEDLSAVITEIVMRPFSSRRTQELLECMRAMRKTSVEEDEIDAWNMFLTNLKGKCTSQPGNAEFWKQVQGVGQQLGLISAQEAEKHGGTSKFSETEAADLLS